MWVGYIYPRKCFLKEKLKFKFTNKVISSDCHVWKLDSKSRKWKSEDFIALFWKIANIGLLVKIVKYPRRFCIFTSFRMFCCISLFQMSVGWSLYTFHQLSGAILDFYLGFYENLDWKTKSSSWTPDLFSIAQKYKIFKI